MSLAYAKKENGGLVTQTNDTKTNNQSLSLQYSPPKQISQYSINKSQLGRSAGFDKDTYYTDYKRKTREIVSIMDTFLSKEANLAKKVHLPGEYYVLKKNFDLLLSTFKVIQTFSSY